MFPAELFLLHLQKEPLPAPQLEEQAYLRGTEWIDAALQGLTEAAIGLLHALDLGRPGNKGPSHRPCQGGIGTTPRQDPTSADTGATSQQSSLPPTI